MATVRYVNSSSGLNVRSTAAGTKVTTLNNGDLMYDIPGVSTVTASLNGTSYVWVKVHYYKTGTTTKEGDGWVTVNNTSTVSTTVPTKSKVLSSNSSLKQYQQLINARYIHNYLKNNGWSNNAIYAVLGNMEAESYINPGKWESTDDTSKGYGLVQWTPATEYTNWLSSNEDQSDIDNQLDRILYEVKNKLQWISSKHSRIKITKNNMHSGMVCKAIDITKHVIKHKAFSRATKNPYSYTPRSSSFTVPFSMT